MAFGIVWFSLASLLLPLVVMPAVSLSQALSAPGRSISRDVRCAHNLLQCHGTSPPYSAQASTARWVLPAVIAARAMVGLGEGVALPAMNNLVSGQHPQASSALHISKAGHT